MGGKLLKTLFFAFIFIFFLFPITSLHASLPIKILLVPGHDDNVWGAQYGNTKEADMNLRLATELFNILKKDKRFEVHITRDSAGYTKEFADYFTNHQADIVSFRDKAKTAMQDNIANGSFVEKESAPHNMASEDTSIILYGINMWANENKMDAVLHIHFNDYPRPNKWTMGEHKGFVIYIPEDQMLDAKTSSGLAVSVFTELKKKYITSTYEKELGGLIPDQSLIALGSNNTLLPTVRSLLIEYGYIYRFKNTAFRHSSYTKMANLTATGVKKYFFGK